MSTTNSSTSEFAKDIAELELFRRQSKRINVQHILDEQLQKLRANVEEVPVEVNLKLSVDTKTSNASSTGINLRPQKNLTNYAFDESEKFVKLYYTIPDIYKYNVRADESIHSSFKENSFEINCSDINGVDYTISVKGLFGAIDPKKCQVKPKSGDLLLVMLKKTKDGENWGSLLKLEKQQKEKRIPKMDEDNSDPQASIMNLMKKMYDDGDNEMKRTIRKSWYEAQNKNSMGMDMDF